MYGTHMGKKGDYPFLITIKCNNPATVHKTDL